MIGKKGCVGVIPLGEIPPVALKTIADSIETIFGLETEILSPLEKPSYAFDQRRTQYDAAIILNRFKSLPLSNYLKVIGILNFDIFIPVFTHVFGQAQEGGKYALVSMFRLRRDSSGGQASQAQILDRLAKVVIHETGHLFNLPHCMNQQCLMHFSDSLKTIDAICSSLCRYCSQYLKDAIRREVGHAICVSRAYI
ncbi:MAG: archaemetzincin family Zn-dependent metalloprotease [Desulfatiglans sp.]|jgi:archaemetzincin|nr:archaemetzincin family Zn-dependent metalloprotease [Desulfatiglans sp.]